MPVPDSLLYTPEHEWLRLEEGTATVGITAHAAGALGDVVYVDLPAVGTSVRAGTACGEIESTKSVSDLFAPADGEIVTVNQDVVEEPGLLNDDPYGRGWLFQMRLTGPHEALDPVSYADLINNT